MLPCRAEHAHLAIVFGAGLAFPARFRVEPRDVVADNAIGPERSTGSIRQPDIRGNRAPAIHQGSDWDAAADVKKRGIAALVRFQIDGAELHTPIASVIVHGKVCEAGVAALQDLAVDEGRGERPVAVSTGDVVGAEPGRLDVLYQQPKGRPAAYDSGAQNRAVFVLIAGEEMLHNSAVILGGHQDVAGAANHGSSSRKCSTLRNLATAVWG